MNQTSNPARGGSYVRDADGSLRLVEQTGQRTNSARDQAEADNAAERTAPARGARKTVKES